MQLNEMPMNEQMALNLEEGRTRKKVLMYETKAKDQNKRIKKNKKQKDFISRRTEELMSQFGLDKKA